MIYNVTNEFTRLAETAGTIQNNSYIYPIEISNQAVADSGILLYPLNKFTFSGTQLYMRCTDGGAWAEIRVVPFLLDFGTSTATTPAETDTDSDVDELIADALNGDYQTDPDADSVINEMLGNTDPIDTGDGWSDYVNDLFP